MNLKVNGHQAEGALVVPHSESYEFKIKAQGDLDLFTFTTCHREQTKENAGEKGWFKSDKKRQFNYTPAKIEAEGISCPARLGGYEKIKGRHSWGFVDFEHPSLTLPALVSCNGSQYNSRGVSVCQTKAGLMMEIVFPEPVLWPKKGLCVNLVSNDNKVFRFIVPKKQCTFRFFTRTGEEKWHRLTTIGYEKILIRED